MDYSRLLDVKFADNELDENIELQKITELEGQIAKSFRCSMSHDVP